MLLKRNTLPFVDYRKIARGIPTQGPRLCLLLFNLSSDLIEKNQADISGVQIRGKGG